MKQLSQSFIGESKALLSRLSKLLAMGCMLALVCLVGTSAQPQTGGKARPFKANALITFLPTSDLGGDFEVVGNATHLGKFVGEGIYWITGVTDGGTKVHFHVQVTWTAANGDSIDLDMPDWVNDLSVTPATSTGTAVIVGGTGRFAKVSGSMFGIITPPEIIPGTPNDLTEEGTITY